MKSPVAGLFAFLVLVVLPSSCYGTPSTVPVLSRAKGLRLERNFVPEQAARELYSALLDATLPGRHDQIHRDLIGIKGDVGVELHQTLSMAQRVARFQTIANHHDGNLSSEVKESGILRVEHLKRADYDRAKHLINDVVQNTVLEDGGTIHAYLSLPNCAALANHTDVTDIVVLQLRGAKEWLLCQEETTLQQQTSLRAKLAKCSSYNPKEIDQLVCHSETLFPGDALFLPKRVVHSARATQDGLSAHLTFGFVDNVCAEDSGHRSALPWNTPRFLEGTTCDTYDEGESCDSDCDSCNYSCDGCCGIDGYNCYCSCDDSCNGCNSSCDTCPTGGADNPGSIIGIVVGVVVAIGLCSGGGWYYWNTHHKKNGELSPSATPASEANDDGHPAAADAKLMDTAKSAANKK